MKTYTRSLKLFIKIILYVLYMIYPFNSVISSNLLKQNYNQIKYN